MLEVIALDAYPHPAPSGCVGARKGDLLEILYREKDWLCPDLFSLRTTGGTWRISLVNVASGIVEYAEIRSNISSCAPKLSYV